MSLKSVFIDGVRSHMLCVGQDKWCLKSWLSTTLDRGVVLAGRPPAILLEWHPSVHSLPEPTRPDLPGARDPITGCTHTSLLLFLTLTHGHIFADCWEAQGACLAVWVYLVCLLCCWYSLLCRLSLSRCSQDFHHPSDYICPSLHQQMLRGRMTGAKVSSTHPLRDNLKPLQLVCKG